MNIVAALLGEHGILIHQLQALRLRAPALADTQLEAAAFALAEAIQSHAALEDELLFDPLEASGAMPPGPVAAMRHEHRTIETLLGRLLDRSGNGPTPESPQRTLLRLADTLSHHFAHEEHVLFPLASRALDASALDELGARWSVRRGVEIAGVPSSALEPAPACALDSL